MNNGIITVIGKDKVGIIAKVCNLKTAQRNLMKFMTVLKNSEKK